MRSQATAFGTASTSTSPSQRTGRTSRNQVFQVPSASCAAQRGAARVPEVSSQRRHNGRRGQLHVFHRPIHKCGERTREARAPLIMMTGRPAAGGGTPTGEDRRSEAVTKGEGANLANALGTNKGSRSPSGGDKSARLGCYPQAPSADFPLLGRRAATTRVGCPPARSAGCKRTLRLAGLKSRTRIASRAPRIVESEAPPIYLSRTTPHTAGSMPVHSGRTSRGGHA